MSTRTYAEDVEREERGRMSAGVYETGHRTLVGCRYNGIRTSSEDALYVNLPSGGHRASTGLSSRLSSGPGFPSNP